jgi:hypothetical protein
MKPAYDRLKTIHDETSIEMALGSIRYGEFLIKSGKPELAKEILTNGQNVLNSFENSSSPRQMHLATLLQSLN